VGGVLHAKVPTLNCALETLALGSSRYVNFLTLLKSLNGKLRSHLKSLFGPIKAELPKTVASSSARLGIMPSGWLADP
jgi:hypothetical protein